MSTSVICKRCLFQVTIGLNLGHLAVFSPDQAKMARRCIRAKEPGFAYDCLDLTSALLATLESEARRVPAKSRESRAGHAPPLSQ